MTKAPSRMFSEVTRTWNPVVGCHHGCVYCFAMRLAETRLSHLPRYRGGFSPRLVPEELRHRFHHGTVFVSSMGDLWAAAVRRDDILAVLDVVEQSPGALFLFLTKNPRRYMDFNLPANCIAGVTVETNDYRGQPIAPGALLFPLSRMAWMQCLPEGVRRFVSIEPIMRFHQETFLDGLRRIAPEFVYVGYDNHGHKLPEPSLAETEALIKELQTFTEVRRKTIRKAWWEK